MMPMPEASLSWVPTDMSHWFVVVLVGKHFLRLAPRVGHQDTVGGDLAFISNQFGDGVVFPHHLGVCEDCDDDNNILDLDAIRHLALMCSSSAPPYGSYCYPSPQPLPPPPPTSLHLNLFLRL